MLRLASAMAAVLLTLSLASAASAEDCKPLGRITQVAIKRNQSGMIFVPVSINGQERYMLLDTGGFFNFISPEAQKILNLPVKGTRMQVLDVSGKSASETSGSDDYAVSHVASADDFAIGRARWAGVDFFIARPGGMMDIGDGTQIAGFLGPNLLKDFDVELDLGGNTLSLFSPDHCPGRVIHWPAQAVAVEDLYLADGWHLSIPVTLDGQRLNAFIDTGAAHTTLTDTAAERDLGVKPGSTDTPATRPLTGREGAMVYRHRFGELALDGIVVKNPAIDIIPDLANQKLETGPATGSRFSERDPRDFSDLLLGMDILRNFHIYIAYKEGRVYLTPAGVPPPKP